MYATIYPERTSSNHDGLAVCACLPTFWCLRDTDFENVGSMIMMWPDGVSMSGISASATLHVGV